MKKYLSFGLLVLVSCGRFGTREENHESEARIVCLSKQYNEIIFALGAQKDLVGVDVSSTYPTEIKNIPTVGYHRALSTEGILSTKPTLIIHDNNVGPDQIMEQMKKLQIPMKVFDTKGEDIATTKLLITEMGVYFHKEKQADSLNKKLDDDMAKTIAASSNLKDKPKVVVIHFGRANNVYLTLTKNTTGGKM